MSSRRRWRGSRPMPWSPWPPVMAGEWPDLLRFTTLDILVGTMPWYYYGTTMNRTTTFESFWSPQINRVWWFELNGGDNCNISWLFEFLICWTSWVFFLPLFYHFGTVIHAYTVIKPPLIRIRWNHSHNQLFGEWGLEQYYGALQLNISKY